MVTVRRNWLVTPIISLAKNPVPLPSLPSCRESFDGLRVFRPGSDSADEFGLARFARAEYWHESSMPQPTGLLVLLCYKRSVRQKGQPGICWRM